MIIKLARNNVKRFLREKHALFIYIVLPVIIFAAVIKLTGSDGGSRITVYVTDEDQSSISRAYTAHLEKQKQYRIVQMSITDDESKLSEADNIYTADYLQSLIEAMKISTYMKIEAGFEERFYMGEDIAIKLYGLKESETLRALGQMNNHFFNNMKGLYVGAGKDEQKMEQLMEAYDNDIVKLTSQYTSQNETPSSITFALGILIYFILLTSVKISYLAVEDREEGVYARLVTMPVKKEHYIWGYMLSTSALVWIQILLSVGILVILADVQTVPVVEIILILGLLALCGIALSFFIISLVRKKSVVDILTNGVVMFTSMLAGIFWPYDMMPVVMQKVAKLFPQFWAVDTIKDLFYGARLMDKQLNIVVLGIMAIIFFIAATICMKKKQEA